MLGIKPKTLMFTVLVIVIFLAILFALREHRAPAFEPISRHNICELNKTQR